MGEWVGSCWPSVHTLDGFQVWIDVGDVDTGLSLESWFKKDISDDGSVKCEGAGAVLVRCDMDHNGSFTVLDTGLSLDVFAEVKVAILSDFSRPLFECRIFSGLGDCIVCWRAELLKFDRTLIRS